ncbi:hypothetical protein HAX54_053509, partial [Datura stramonium]|nr:hypothetical protein [Datura stramonium]
MGAYDFLEFDLGMMRFGDSLVGSGETSMQRRTNFKRSLQATDWIPRNICGSHIGIGDSPLCHR